MKIALLGTSSTWKDAPFDDSSWEIWGVSGCIPGAPRIDRLYELHRWNVTDEHPANKGGFPEIARGLGSGFIIRDPLPEYPEARVFDFQKYIKKHGKAPFTSSVAWMLAEAIDQLEASNDDEKIIGLWGINMASDTKYGHQAKGAREMVGYAKKCGIKVGTPPGSELMFISHMYALEEPPEFMKGVAQKKQYFQALLKQQEDNLSIVQADINKFKGAIAALEMIEDNYFRGRS